MTWSGVRDQRQIPVGEENQIFRIGVQDSNVTVGTAV